MPKELIFQRNEHGDPDTTEPVVKVGWSKEAEFVEIATIHKDYVVLEPMPEGNGWFVQLSRREINQLIRALRTARNSAYGKDE